MSTYSSCMGCALRKKETSTNACLTHFGAILGTMQLLSNVVSLRWVLVGLMTFLSIHLANLNIIKLVPKLLTSKYVRSYLLLELHVYVWYVYNARHINRDSPSADTRIVLPILF